LETIVSKLLSVFCCHVKVEIKRVTRGYQLQREILEVQKFEGCYGIMMLKTVLGINVDYLCYI